jgi:GTPase Era involved in 16S rRNA processing
MLQGKVFLELFVKVSKEWRDNKSALKRFGY